MFHWLLCFCICTDRGNYPVKLKFKILLLIKKGKIRKMNRIITKGSSIKYFIDCIAFKFYKFISKNRKLKFSLFQN